MRARNLKPSFFKNEVLAECTALTRLLFQGLWCIADRNGVLENRPKLIKTEALPYDDGADVPAMLSELEKKGFISLYESDGKPFIAILSWKKHARPHRDEPAVFPLPTNVAEKSPGNINASPGDIGGPREINGRLAPLPSSLLLNEECSSTKVQEKNSDTSPTWLTRQWLFHLSRSPMRNESPEDITKLFTEMIRQGANPKQMQAEILNQRRNRNEALWEFEKRLTPKAKPAPEPPRIRDPANCPAEQTARARAQVLKERAEKAAKESNATTPGKPDTG